MVIIRVIVGELLCPAAMGQILVLEYLLLDTCGCLWPCPIMTGIKYHCFLRTRLLVASTGHRETPGRD
jgi:hypothetical protein